MTTATKTQEALAAVTAAVEKIKNDDLQHFPEAANIGDCVRQGDIYIQLIPAFEGAPELYQEMPEPELQLAPGNSKGSRHRLTSADGVTMYAPMTTDAKLVKYYVTKHKLDVDINDEDAIRRFYWGWGGDDDRKHKAKLNEIEKAIEMAGPIFKLDKPNVVTHPEHGDWALASGCYRVIYQRTVDHKQQIARVID